MTLTVNKKRCVLTYLLTYLM